MPDTDGYFHNVKKKCLEKYPIECLIVDNSNFTSDHRILNTKTLMRCTQEYEIVSGTI